MNKICALTQRPAVTVTTTGRGLASRCESCVTTSAYSVRALFSALILDTISDRTWTNDGPVRDPHSADHDGGVPGPYAAPPFPPSGHPALVAFAAQRP